jgi:hypothetical protein
MSAYASRTDVEEYRAQARADHSDEIAEARAEARAEALADRDYDGYESDRANDRYINHALGTS